MLAKLKNLDGKYYGTQIEITLDGEILDKITVWADNWHDSVIVSPSPRELIEITPLDWMENKWLPEIVFQETMEKGCYAQEYFPVYDTHYENCTTYYIALKIIDCINGTKLSTKFKPTYDKLKGLI
jgi:hypothetical protein